MVAELVRAPHQQVLALAQAGWNFPEAFASETDRLGVRAIEHQLVETRSVLRRHAVPQLLNHLASIRTCRIPRTLQRPVPRGTITLVDSDSAHSPTDPSDGGNPVAAQWDLLRNDETYYRRFLDRDLIEAVYAHPQLRVLFPFTSANVLHLSRCTRHPFSLDVLCVVPDGNGRFEVKRTPNMFAGPRMIGVSVTVAEAVALIAAHLPEGSGPAIDGTVEDLR